MNKLSQLIQELCPEGVEYKELNNISEMTRGTSLTKAKAKTGKIPVISGGKEPAFFCNIFNRTGETITVAGSGVGAGYVQYWNIPIFANDSFTIKGNKFAETKYLYYCLTKLQNKIFDAKKGGGVPHVHISDIEHFKIPLPPLPVQQEIVRILDSFTDLSAELKAELKARKKQYEYYRDKLLRFDTLVANLPQGKLSQLIQELCPEGVEYKKLGEFTKISRGGNLQKKDLQASGVPCIHYGQIYTRYGLYTDKTFSYISEECAKKQKMAYKNDIVMAVTSENIEDVCKCVTWLGNEAVAVSGHTAIIQHNQNAKYLTYFFHSEMFSAQKRKIVHGTKVMEVTPSSLNNLSIPLPPLPVQQEIVRILDNFDTLCNDLTAGLPAEIKAREKQYEYYRDKLLTFKELPSTPKKPAEFQQQEFKPEEFQQAELQL